MSLVWWARNAQSPVGSVAPSDSLSVADPMTAGKSTAQVPGLCGRLATAISLGFTAADVAAQEVAPKVMTAGEAVYTENCAHCHKATGQGDGGAAGAEKWWPIIKEFGIKVE